MIRIPVRNTIVSPSLDLIKYQSSLMVIAAYAKAANQIELYNQAKEAHDNTVRQYNARTAPKKKSFWEQFKDNLTFNMDTQVAIPQFYLEEDPSFSAMCEVIRGLSSYQVLEGLRDAVARHNRVYGT